jgi:anti-sigma-K factor RskA
VHGEWSVEFVRDRNAGLLEEAGERRLARLAAGAAERPSLRARVARRLFGFAVALEREETWRAVWERLEAPRHP